MTDVRRSHITNKPNLELAMHSEWMWVVGVLSYQGIDFGCNTTVSAIPAVKRYNVNIKSA
jgi:hypothetical protein